MTTHPMPSKPLGIKTYGSIPHLPSSRMGPGDHHCSPGQARICCVKARDKHDYIWVQEKLDGSCMGVALHQGNLIALGRAGYPADTSPHLFQRLFASWVNRHEERFRAMLQEGERAVGEWLVLAHGTRYVLPHEPWVLFDIMTNQERQPAHEVVRRSLLGAFTTPTVLHHFSPISIERVQSLIAVSNHGAINRVEGAVWRVEHRGSVDFLAKWVWPDKVDGLYLEEVSGQPSVWNVWPPSGWEGDKFMGEGLP